MTHFIIFTTNHDYQPNTQSRNIRQEQPSTAHAVHPALHTVFCLAQEPFQHACWTRVLYLTSCSIERTLQIALLLTISCSHDPYGHLGSVILFDIDQGRGHMCGFALLRYFHDHRWTTRDPAAIAVTLGASLAVAVAASSLTTCIVWVEPRITQTLP